MNNTPLLRFKAAEVRESAETVSKKIQDKIKERMVIVDEAQTEKES